MTTATQSIFSVAATAVLSWNSTIAIRQRLEFGDLVQVNCDQTSPVPVSSVTPLSGASLGGQVLEKRTFPDLSDQMIKMIGNRGVTRLQNFWEIESGWDNEAGKQLNIKSLNALEQFLGLSPFFPVTPSVFMSRQGNIILQWKAQDGGTSAIEFDPEYFAYSLAPSYEEGEVASDFQQELVDMLKKQEAV